MSEADTTAERGDAFIAEVLGKWRYRFVANGIPLFDLERLEREIGSWDEWCDGFARFGEEYVALGEAALDRGDERSAGDHFRRAAMFFHFGSHYWHVDETRRETAHRRAVEVFQRAGTYLSPPVERIEAPYSDGGYTIPANLRVPDHTLDGIEGDSPLVILLPGGDSIKEELHWMGLDLIERGIATLAVDGAAQGETWYNQPLTPEYHRLISAVIDHVEDADFPGVDVSSLGVYGVSRGGYYAPHVAANDDRVDLCVGFSGRYIIGPVSAGSELTKEHYLFNCHTDSLVEADDITEQMTLRGDIDRLTVPTLMMTGGRDEITPPAQTQRVAEHAQQGEYIEYEEGYHVCNNIPHKTRSRIGHWLATRFSER